MKKFAHYIFITCFLLSVGTALRAQAVDKQTYTFAIKGRDTLRVDKYSLLTSAEDTLSRPVVLFVFGGGFKGGARYSHTYLPYFNFLVRNGFVVVSTDYRTGLKNVDQTKMSSMAGFSVALQRAIGMAVEDVYDATSFIVGQSKAWKIDPNRIVACGSSAGAVTVLQAEYEICNQGALTKQLPEGFNYAGVVSFAGAVCAKGTPQWKGSPCPIMFFHGDADRMVPFNKAVLGETGLWGSNFICSQLKEKGSPYYFYLAEGAGHEVSSTPMRNNHYDILSFLSRLVLGNQKQCITTIEATPGKEGYATDFTTEDYIRENMQH